jgi:translocation and assembly module TamB
MPEETDNNQAEDAQEAPASNRGKRRSLPGRRSLTVAALAIVVLASVALIIVTVLYQTGTIDSYIKGQFVEAFDEMGIEFRADRFTVQASPLTMRLENAVFTNKKNGRRLGSIGNARFGLTVLDLFALSTERNVNIDTAEISGLELLIDIDKDGSSNFDGVEILPPKNRVKFRYEAARVSVRDSVVRFGDVSRKISGDASDVALVLAPADRGGGDADVKFRYDLSTSEAQFTYGDEKVDPIGVRWQGVLTEAGFDIDNLTISSPIGNSVLAGTVRDWKALKYDLKVVSDIDLTQASTVFPLGTAITGTGGLTGRVTGSGEKYRIEGEVTSERLAASNVRLRSLQVNAVAEGEGSLYNASGKAIAEMLTFGDFTFDYPQVTGNIRGNGTDFKWFGALQSAALNSPLGTVGSLYINDAAAEYRDNRLLMNLSGVRARKFTSADANLESIQTPSIRIVYSDGVTNATVGTATAERLDAEGATLGGVTVSRVEIEDRPADTDITAGSVRADRVTTKDASLGNVTAEDVRVNRRNGSTRINSKRITAETTRTDAATLGRIEAGDVAVDVVGDTTRIDTPSVRVASVETDSAILANLNIAGVRLSVRKGRIEGSTADFVPGTVDLKERGKLEEVAVYKPVFVLEPAGRYRASMDMTLGSGLIGTINLGAARASVVADNDRIELNDLDARIMDGQANGSAVIALREGFSSEIKADFTDLDVSKVLAIGSGSVFPLEGKTSGRADVRFPGTDVRRPTGTLTATVTATAGNDERGFLPVSGNVEARANEGLVTLAEARLTSGKSVFTATGDLDLSGEDSDLALVARSSDAGEVERLIRIFELSPQLQDQLDSLDGHFAGNFNFNGTLTGSMDDPYLSGSASLDSIIARSRDLGSLSAQFSLAPTGLTITDGKLQEDGGGNMVFSAVIPAGGRNNTSVAARLDRFNIGTLLTAVPIKSLPASLQDLRAPTSGELDLAGLPDDMRGKASLRAEAGTLNGQTFDELLAVVSFDGTLVTVNKFDGKFGDGLLNARGTYRTDTKAFDINVDANDVPATRLLAFIPKDSRVPEAGGSIDLEARAAGLLDDTASYEVSFKGSGEGILVNGNSFGAISFEGRTVNRVLTANLVSHAGGGEQKVVAEADLGLEDVPFRATSDFENVPLGPFIAIFRKPAPDKVELGGSASGKVSLAGNLVTMDDSGKRVFTSELLRGSALLDKFSFQVGETALDATNAIDITFDFNQVTVDNAKFSGGGTNLTVNGTKALTDNGVNNLALNGRMDLRVLNAISSNFFFSGLADVEISLTGVNRNARLNGRAQLERGSVATFIGSERITLEAMKGCVLFNTTQVQIGCNDGRSEGEEIVGRLGGGRVGISGAVILTDDLLIDDLRLDVKGTNITAPLPVDFTTTGNADLVISGKRGPGGFGALVSGNFFARRSVYTRDIDLADFISGRRDASLSTGSDDTSLFADTRLDIRLYGRDALIVRNNIADLTASADLRVTGDVETPRISGRITANRGTIFFRDDRYDVQRGVLTFPPNTTIEPLINLQAETEIAGYQVFVVLNGNLTDTDSLTATLRSNPALPQADVVSLITTGSLSNTGTGIPTYAQSGLNTAAEILTDEIINKPITRATDKLFGLNRFTLDPIVTGQRGNATARLTVGRQINRNLLVTYSTNLSQDQNQVLALEYRVSNRLSFVAQYEQRPLTNVTRNRNNFSFEIRLRKRF